MQEIVKDENIKNRLNIIKKLTKHSVFDIIYSYLFYYK